MKTLIKISCYRLPVNVTLIPSEEGCNPHTTPCWCTYRLCRPGSRSWRTESRCQTCDSRQPADLSRETKVIASTYGSEPGQPPSVQHIPRFGSLCCDITINYLVLRYHQSPGVRRAGHKEPVARSLTSALWAPLEAGRRTEGEHHSSRDLVAICRLRELTHLLVCRGVRWTSRYLHHYTLATLWRKARGAVKYDTLQS